jgi:O-methyltransferase
MSLPAGSFANSPLLGERAANVYEWFVKSLHLPGDAAECGVYRGETSRELVRYLDENRLDKCLHMFDTFKGFPEVITSEERALAEGHELGVGRFHGPLEAALEQMSGASRYKIHRGLFSETFPAFSGPLCFIHADADLYQSTVEIIRLADRCLVPGGHIVFDDYDNPLFPGINLAIERHLSRERYAVTPSPATIQCFATRR